MSTPIRVYLTPIDQPEFIRVQKTLLDKYLLDPFEYVVLSHAHTREMADKIAKVCQELGVEHHVLDVEPLPWINNVDHSIAMQLAWDEWCLKDKGPVVFVHNDMFPMAPFSFLDYLGDNHVSAVLQTRGPGDKVRYLSSHVFLANPASMPNPETIDMGCGVIEGEHVDVCGRTHYWLKENPDAKVRWMEMEWLSNQETCKEVLGRYPDLLETYNPVWGCEYLGKMLFHYGRGTNWDNQSQSWVQAKREWFERWVEQVVKEK